MTDTIRIVAIPAPTDESEARKHALQDVALHRVFTQNEQAELLSLEMRQFWNCEC